MRPDDRTSPERRRLLLALAGGIGACALGAAGGVAEDRLRAPDHRSALDKLLGRHPRTTNDLLRLDADPAGVFGVHTDEPVVALTFDDGPDGRYTPSVLDLLGDRGAHASFFTVGVNALAHPDLVARLAAEGHSIGDHTRTHRALDRLDRDGIADEILGGLDDLVAAGGPRPDLFRPPYGLTDEFVGAFAAGARLRSVYWSTSLEHHLREPSIDRAVERLLDGIRPGDIVLAHDGSGAVGRPEHRRTDRSRTLRALPRLLDGLAARGYRVLDVPRLLDAGEPRRSGELRHG